MSILCNPSAKFHGVSTFKDKLGLIAPYKGQVRVLRRLIGETIRINSVDGFQG